MDTICWDCAKCSDSKQCSWANGVPRTDWEVVPTYINNQGRPPIQSYIVVKCDGFAPVAITSCFETLALHHLPGFRKYFRLRLLTKLFPKWGK